MNRQVEVDYAQDPCHRHHVHYHGLPGRDAEHSSHHAQHHPIVDDGQRSIPLIPENAHSKYSTLGNALEDVTLTLNLSRSANTYDSPPQSTRPPPPVLNNNTLPDMPAIEDEKRDTYTFICETGLPEPITPCTSSRVQASNSPSETESQPRRKRQRAANRGPPKDPGFLACLFCRGRKISCTMPPAGSEDRTCG